MCDHHGELPPFEQPTRVYLGLDGVLVRGRTVKTWIEVQVGSFWSAWQERTSRKTPRREITNRTLVARTGGWEKLGEQIWRRFVQREGVRLAAPEVVVLGDGAAGIRSLGELYFPRCRALLDPWHLGEKVKQRAKEVFRHRERALGAAQVAYTGLQRGNVAEARACIEFWPASTVTAQESRTRLLAYLERNADIIRDYEQLRPGI